MGFWCIVFVCSLALTAASPLPGEATTSSADIPQAEPHSLAPAMNIPPSPSHRSHLKPMNLSSDGCSDPNGIMSSLPKQLVETQESIQNGERNGEYLTQRHQENQDLPSHIRHKTLTEIWQKETPCNCPFNVWKPVCGVDGNTYPTECFAKCGEVEIFFHADCKYVKAELWKKMHDQGAIGRVDLSKDDYNENELCIEGDDDGNDPRPKCPRPSSIEPFPEGQEPVSPPLRGFATTAIQLPQQQRITKSEQHEPHQPQEHQPLIEYRTFNGMQVPYYTGPIENPCPQCDITFKPVCGNDDKTYPSQCFAVCVGAVVKRVGRCVKDQ